MREALVRTLVIFGVLTTLLTETLSVFHLLRPLPLAAAYVSAVALAVWGGFSVHSPEWRAAWPGWFDAALMLGIVAIEGVVLLTALLSPPNSADAMAYHMPRIVYWAQNGSVAFFPTPYYNQIMLQPMAEYLMLGTYVLSGGDRFINLVQFLGSVGSIVGVSLIARSLGGSRRAQVLAALFCATLPNGILQASGAKNDYLVAFWLVAMAWFALEYRRSRSRGDLLGFGCALGLALLTKATAYLFAGPLILATLLPLDRRRMLRAGAVAAACVFLLNVPQFWRNLRLSGSPLGFDSAQGDGVFRWRNEHPGWRATASNILRNLSEQFGARSPRWNQGVYDAVVRIHGWLGLAIDDPETTWPGVRFEPPRNANHEANAHNRWHLLILMACATAVGFAGRREWSWYCLALAAGFVLFCFYLKWQPFLARLVLPLFVLGAPLAGVLGERIRPLFLQAALCLLLLNNARPFLFENWTRPLEGPRSLWKTSRSENYFNDMSQWNNRASYLESVRLTLASGCKQIGIDISRNTLEYPYQALLRSADPSIRFVHTGVENASARYASIPAMKPCVILCLDCAPVSSKRLLYADTGKPVEIGYFLLFGSRR